MCTPFFQNLIKEANSCQAIEKHAVFDKFNRSRQKYRLKACK